MDPGDGIIIHSESAELVCREQCNEKHYSGVYNHDYDICDLCGFRWLGWICSEDMMIVSLADYVVMK